MDLYVLLSLTPRLTDPYDNKQQIFVILRYYTNKSMNNTATVLLLNHRLKHFMFHFF